MAPSDPAPETGPQKHLFLIDGYSFVFRAYHSLARANMTRPDGTPIGAVFGFTNMLLKLKDAAEKENHHYMLVVFDAGAKTFRNDIYREYKAHRPPAPEDLIPQFPIVQEAAQALGLKTMALPGYEADDVIATYAVKAKKEGMRVTIVSSDKDLMQLVDDQVEMYDSMKDKRIGPTEVQEKFGVPPEKVLDMLALMGDSADNIPGVPGIGPKTAAELLNQYGSLEGILEHTSEIPQKKRRETLIENADQARLSRELATLHYEVPVEHAIEDLTVNGEDAETILRFLKQQGFKSLITRFEAKHNRSAAEFSVTELPEADNENQPKAPKNSAPTCTLARKASTLAPFLARIVETGQFAILPVYNGEPALGRLKAVALAASTHDAAYIPLDSGDAGPSQSSLSFGDEESEIEAHSPSGEDSAPLTQRNVLKLLAPLLADNGIRTILHQAKSFLHTSNLPVTAMEDLQVMSYALDGAQHKHELDTILNQHTHTDCSLILDDTLGGQLAGLSNEEAAMELAQVVMPMIQARDMLWQKLFDAHLLTVYETIDRPLVPILHEMEKVGVRVDQRTLAELSQEFASRLHALELEVYRHAGVEFNLGSPKQLGEILFDQMKLPGGKKSKNGAWATGAEILENLAAEGHIIAEKLLEWRSLSKLRSTYTDALPKQINPQTGRVHSTFTQTVTSTGRLSSHNPNLQNIPIRTEEGRRLRTAFTAPDGWQLISADYSQIELRLLAHIAEIDTLRQAFKEGKDIHAITASQVFNVPLEHMDPITRRKAKAVNFGIIYGQSAFGLAKQLGIPRNEAQTIIARYFEQYPGIRRYMDHTIEQAREQGYVTTLYGRRCYLHGINSKNGALRQFAERAAINAPLQGTAADIIRKAMIRVDRALQSEKLNARMVLQVHDELILEARESDVDAAKTLIQREMEAVVTLSVPLVAEAASGNHWGEIH